MTNPKRHTRKVVIKNFFGYRPGDGLKQFAAELAELSEEEQTELAQLAAEELGVELEEAK
jgi:hypothetical protein